MSRTILTASLALCLAGCEHLDAAQASAPAAPGALDCALAEATALGYATASAEAGVYVRLERVRRSGAYDVLNATASPDRLTVLGYTEAVGEGGRQRATTSATVRQHAADVAARCAR